MSPEPGSEVGGQRKENISHTWSVFFFKLKRASNNIQKKSPAGLPAGRCRCASQADEGLCQNCICLVPSEEYCIVSCDTRSFF